MRVICTTSNKYLHLIPVFTYLFNRSMPDYEVTILGYDAPKCELPDNFEFHSIGVQGDVSEWSTDLRRYIEQMDDTHFIFFMEDQFIRWWKEDNAITAYALMFDGVGRIDLTGDVCKRPHRVDNGIAWADAKSRYRLSTQVSIWNREYLLTYLTDGMSPWIFETQDAFDDKWAICGLVEPAIKCNEGVRKHNPHELDLNGFDADVVDHIKTLLV